MKRCPCCGYLTIDDLDEVITDICEVCYWQYDEVSQNNPLKSIGPNKISLVQVLFSTLNAASFFTLNGAVSA